MTPTHAPVQSRWIDRFGPAIAILAGTFAVFHRQILSGFAWSQTYPQDPLFQNWILEHGWRWLRGAPLARDLWSPPLFHPEPGVLAFADPQIGLLVFYAPARALAAPPHVAYALAGMAALAATFAAFRWLYRGAFDLPAPAATLGAWLVAYGAPRAAALNHSHLFAQMPTAVALFALLAACDDRRDRRSRRLWIAALPVAVALQVWANVYLGALLGLLIALMAVPLALDAGGRQALRALGRRGAAALLAGALAAGLLLAPLGAALASARTRVAGPTAAEIALYQPRAGDWLNPGGFDLVEPWLERALGVLRQAPVEWAHRLGLGLFTSVLVLAGIVVGRDRRPFRWLGTATLLLALLALRIDGIGSLWTPLYQLCEPLRALRVVSRVGLLALPVAGAAVALAATRLAGRVSRPILALALAMVAAEQVQVQPAFPLAPRDQRAREIAAAIPPDCDSFFYSPVRGELAGRQPPGDRAGAIHQVDAMWAAFEAQRPTLNGYSSHGPHDWPLAELVLIEERDLPELRAGLRDWIDRRGLRHETVCWLRARVRRERIESVEIERFRAGSPSGPG